MTSAAADTEPRADFRPLPTRFWQLLLAFHVAAACVWWWLMPGGFPLGHAKFWCNRALPVVVAAAGSAGVWALARRNVERTATIVTAVPLFWSGMLAAVCALFPTSAWRIVGPGLLPVACFWTAWFRLSPVVRLPRRHPLVLWNAAIFIGMFAAWSQRAPEPTTHPLDEPLPDFVFDRENRGNVDAFQRGGVTIAPATASITVAKEKISIEINPLLRFESRSPDRCWALFAPPEQRRAANLRLIGGRWTDDQVLLRYADDGAHVLRVRSYDKNGCELEAFSQLRSPVYSHLNASCEITIRGHFDLSLTFSPCGETPINVPPSDYPTGRPARFAYLGADGVFRVVEATNGEKGPFRTLQEGPLARDGELRIGVREAGRPVATLAFADWARQASTALSPTAGWGVPQNAVEFRRQGENAGSPVTLWLTPAATSVGRGFDTVGHAAGTYRNRVRVEIAAE